MVNFARMEPVWRSYGPLEPLGKPARPRRRTPRRALAGGLVAVCLAGGAGLYLRPDLPETRPAAPVPAPQAVTRVSGEGGAAAPLEAAQLQSQLQLLVITDAVGSAADAVAPTPAARSPTPVSASSPTGAVAALAVRSRPTPAAVVPSPVRRTAPRTPPRPTSAAPRSQALVVAGRKPTPAAPLSPRAAQPRPKRPPSPAAAPDVQPEPGAAEPAPRGPSYDCGYARTAAERMICGSPELAALDRNMAAELDAAVAAGHSPRELARDQANWRQRRETAAPDPRAVADVYRQRIGQLRSMQ